MPIPVICDRCRSTGNAGEADFSHLGDLLEFDPVPRKHDRVDGRHAERQLAFIAALAATGSKRRAAQSLLEQQRSPLQCAKPAWQEGVWQCVDSARSPYC